MIKKARRFFSRRPALGVFLCAAALRAGFVFSAQAIPACGLFAVDAPVYNSFARRLCDGVFFQAGSLYFGAFYPFFLSAFYFLFGGHIIMIGAAQALLDASTCALIYYIAMACFGKRAAAAAAAFAYAFYGMAVFFTVFLLDVTLLTFFYAAFIALVIRIDRTRDVFMWVFAGIIFGMALLMKGFHAVFLPFFLIWLIGRLRKKALYAIALFALGIAIPIAPISARNHVLIGSWSPFPVNSGLNFYIGNNPAASGFFQCAPQVPAMPVDQMRAARVLAREIAGRPVALKELSWFWAKQGLLFMKQFPRGAFRLTLKKLWLFWQSFGFSIDISYPFMRTVIPFLRLPFIPYGALAPFALAGIFISLRRLTYTKALVLLFTFSYMSAVVLCYLTIRLRFPIVVFLCVFAGAGAGGILSLMKKGKTHISLAILIVTALFIFTNSYYLVTDEKTLKNYRNNEFRTAETNLAGLFIARGRMKEAYKRLSRLLSKYPNNPNAQFQMGAYYMKRNDPARAIPYYLGATRRISNVGSVYLALGRAYEETGDITSAIHAYHNAIRFNSSQAPAHAALVNLYSETGDTTKAIAALSHLLRVKPDSARGYYNMGNLFARRGGYDAAIAYYKKAVYHNPRFPGAWYNLGAAYFGKGALDKALAAHTRALSLAPKNGMIHYALALDYYNKKKYKTALGHFIAALNNGYSAVAPELYDMLRQRQ